MATVSCTHAATSDSLLNPQMRPLQRHAAVAQAPPSHPPLHCIRRSLTLLDQQVAAGATLLGGLEQQAHSALR